MAPHLGDVLAHPYGRVLQKWLATGPGVVGEIRDELAGTRRAVVPGRLADRELLDNLSTAVAAVASTYPDEYLQAFRSPRWRGDTFVVGGLGFVDRPEALARLLDLLGDRTEQVRMDAVLGLGRSPSPAAARALATALDDPAYLVRYHALDGLARVGDESCRPALEAHRVRGDVPPIEREMAATALDAITRRR